MPVKKSEHYSSIWQSCDQLRGGMDASQYKDYVLVLRFVKYVSDKYAGRKDALLVVPKGGGFADMVALKEKPDFTVGKLKYKAELVPPTLMIARYFSSAKAAIENLEAEVALIEQQLEELKDEHAAKKGCWPR